MLLTYLKQDIGNHAYHTPMLEKGPRFMRPKTYTSWGLGKYNKFTNTMAGVKVKYFIILVKEATTH